MNRALFLVLCVLVMTTAAMGVRSQEPHAAGTSLPGARFEIDAARYPSLQAALDALPPEGGMVRLPAGVFEIEEPLRIRSDDVCVVGAGTATHIRNVNQKNQSAIVAAHDDSKPAGRDQDHELWRLRLADFRLTGNPASGHGVEARGVNEIFVDGLTISEHGGHGILLDYCYEDPRVSDCLITYNQGVGVKLQGCHDIVVSSNQFEENLDAVHCFDGFNLCMTGNCVDDHLGRGVVIENTYGSVLSGNMIEECAAAAVVLDRDCYGITISANVIAHNGAGVDLRDAHGCAISANTFTIMQKAALRIAETSSRIAVSANSFCNSYVGQGSVRRRPDDSAAAGMELDGAREIGISSNVFSGVGPKALAATPETRGVLFAGNLLVDTASDHAELSDSKVTGNLERP